MRKIEIIICCGTHCHVLGGADLQLLSDKLSPQLKKISQIRYSPCLGCCVEQPGNPPYAIVNGKTIPEATIESIKLEIKSYLGGIQDGC